jgi:hypothetical protein
MCFRRKNANMPTIPNQLTIKVMPALMVSVLAAGSDASPKSGAITNTTPKNGYNIVAKIADCQRDFK